MTHEAATPTDYFGNRRIIKNVLAAFSVEQTVKWFASLGVELKRRQTGEFFPVTDKADYPDRTCKSLSRTERHHPSGPSRDEHRTDILIQKLVLLSIILTEL